MADFKGNQLVTMRRLIKPKDKETEKAFRDQLTPEEQQLYHTPANITVAFVTGGSV